MYHIIKFHYLLADALHPLVEIGIHTILLPLSQQLLQIGKR